MFAKTTTQFGKKIKKGIDTGALRINEWNGKSYAWKNFGKKEKKFIKSIKDPSQIPVPYRLQPEKNTHAIGTYLKN